MEKLQRKHTSFLFGKHCSVRNSDKDSTLRVADSQLALQGTYYVFRFLALASGKKFGDDGYLLVLRLYDIMYQDQVDSSPGKRLTA